MAERLVVIGGVAAGMSAAAKARRENPDLEVVVYERNGYISYAACGMPYWLAGDVPDIHDLIVRTPQQMARQGVQVHLYHEVTAIDPKARTVTVRDLEQEREFSQDYDHLVVATGARAAEPPLDRPAPDLAGVLELRSLESGLAVRQFLDEHAPRRAVIVGGGYIAVEMAETFHRLGLEVTMLIRSGQVLRTTLDDDVRPHVEEELARHGVEVIRARPLVLEGEDRVTAVVADAGTYPCDLVLLGVGARPDVELAHQAGVALGSTGAIATDERMQTNLPGIYAAGDCAETLHLVTGRPVYLPLGSTANKHGRVAGTNIAGGRATFGGVVGTMIVRCFELGVASTGLTTAQAQALGYDVEVTTITARHLSHYFPGASRMVVKLIADGKNGRLLGGQIVGAEAAAKRIDTLATALHNRMTVADLRRLDLAYAPPFAPVWDPILVAANVMDR